MHISIKSRSADFKGFQGNSRENWVHFTELGELYTEKAQHRIQVSLVQKSCAHNILKDAVKTQFLSSSLLLPQGNQTPNLKKSIRTF